MTIRQIPSLILPRIWEVGTELEPIADLLEHTSIEMSPLEALQEKVIHVMAVEVVAAGIPGNLWVWVETSPYPTTTSAAYWSAIGGGGGALAPLNPVIIVPTGVLGTVHTVIIPWTLHSPYARLVAQTPVAATPATDFWRLQAIVSGKGP